jgi:subtilisin family serine protease
MCKATRLGSLLLALAACASAGDRYLLRTHAGKIDAVVERHGLAIIRDLRGSGRGLAAVELPRGLDPSALSADPDVENVELDRALRLPERSSRSSVASRYQAATFGSARLVDFYGVQARDMYVNQAAGNVVNVRIARMFNFLGAGTVAILDTGVAEDHPVLASSLVAGWDFVHNKTGGSEWSDLDQSTTAILDQSTTAILDQSTTAILDQSTTAILDTARVVVLNQSTTAILDQSTTAILDKSDLPPAFGHGTMVAGIVHLVAPKAKIMPVKVFGGDGTATVSTIVQGIYWAVDNGADVLNMSFSAADPSQEMQNAIQYAVDRGVICVASVGNDGEQTNVYPAGYAAIGVGSTDNLLRRSSFSNYGNSTDLAAPGEGIVTLYPGNHYAAGWGTSFSAPFVAGGAALVVQLGTGANESQAARALSQAVWIGQGLGAGELDLLQAGLYALIHSR